MKIWMLHGAVCDVSGIDDRPSKVGTAKKQRSRAFPVVLQMLICVRLVLARRGFKDEQLILQDVGGVVT